jgi:hypothetical protein
MNLTSSKEEKNQSLQKRNFAERKQMHHKHSTTLHISDSVLYKIHTNCTYTSMADKTMVYIKAMWVIH